MDSGSSRLFSEMSFDLGEFSRFYHLKLFFQSDKKFYLGWRLFTAGLFFEIDYVTLITASGCMAIVVKLEFDQ